MIVAVASGKGGTGKTTVAASLAEVWDGPLTAVDLDVEEPNLHLFLKPEFAGHETASLTVPEADAGKCSACGECARICQSKAIALLGETLLLFPEMCHGCGGCLAVCPTGALSPGRRELGEVGWGRAGGTEFLMGRLRVGEAMSPPLMRAVRARLRESLAERPGDAIIDAPPGVSCPAVNAVLDAEVIVLVTEPTPFGFHDLRLAQAAFAPLGRPMGVIVNRAGLGLPDVYDYCRETGLPLLGELPLERATAQAYAAGQIIARLSPAHRARFEDLAEAIRTLGRAGALAAGSAEAGHD